MYNGIVTEIAPHIVIDPKLRFGKPTVQGTRITVDEVLGWLAGGMTAEEIEREYGVPQQNVLAVIAYAASFVMGEAIEASSQTA